MNIGANIPLRKRILLTIDLDGFICRDNIKQFPPKEKADFICVLAQRLGIKQDTVKRYLRRETGISLEHYPYARSLIQEALDYYNF